MEDYKLSDLIHYVKKGDLETISLIYISDPTLIKANMKMLMAWAYQLNWDHIVFWLEKIKDDSHL